jgi:NAD(P) transhydrogenase subunit beta
VLQNPALMIAGMVVGAAGMLLTLLMAKAMNRSVSNVVFTNFGEVAKHKRGQVKGELKPMQPGDAGIATTATTATWSMAMHRLCWCR